MKLLRKIKKASEPVAPEEQAGEARMVLEGHTDSVLLVDATPDSKAVVSSSRDNTLWVWNLETGQRRTSTSTV